MIRIAYFVNKQLRENDLLNLENWTNYFKKYFETGAGACLFFRENTLPQSQSKIFCFHKIHIAENIDRYIRDRGSVLHSPWGLKSGPNFQFFEILNQMNISHSNSWTFLLEDDVFFLDDTATLPTAIFSEDPETWVVGAKNSSLTLNLIDFNIWNHINGAAFYRTGDQMFMRFLNTTWKQSLLTSVQSRAYIAFDTLTDLDNLDFLDYSTKLNWFNHRSKFKVTKNYINASNLLIGDKDTLNFLTHLVTNESKPIMAVHAKFRRGSFDKFAEGYKKLTS